MSFPTYEDIKKSGISWVGTIPTHWDCTRLKNIFQLMKRSPEPDDGIVTAFRDGEVTLRSNRRTDGYTNAIQEHGYQRVLPNDLVIHAMDAFAGAIGVSDSTGKSTPVYSVCRLRDPEYDVHYFGRLLRHMALSGYINSLAKGIRERSTEFRWKESANTVIPVPPSDEQKAIASFLDSETSKIDALVSEQRRLIELLKEKQQAIISHAVTKGLNPDVKMKPSGIQWLGDVPEHWQVKRVKHTITSIEQGWSPQCENEPVQSDDQWGVLKVGCVNYGKFTAEENKALPGTLDPQPELGIRENDLLISRANTIELVGSAAVSERDHANLMLCDKLYRLRMDHSQLLPQFLCFFLNCEVAREPIELGASGASPSMKNISQSVILELWFATPHVTEQREIVNVVKERWNAITELIVGAEHAIELLQERRTALISAAVTGKIDVRGFAPKEALV